MSEKCKKIDSSNLLPLTAHMGKKGFCLFVFIQTIFQLLDFKCHTYYKEKSPSKCYNKKHNTITSYDKLVVWLTNLWHKRMIQCTCLYYTFLGFTHRNSNLGSLEKGLDSCIFTSVTSKIFKDTFTFLQ